MSGRGRRARIRRTRFGALFWVAFMFLGSALLRLGLETAPAIAREAMQPDQGDAPAAHHAEQGSGSDAELDQLMQALKARETRVETREKQIEERLKALRIADQKISEKMTALTEMESALRETLALADGASEADLARLTSVYEKMKPKDSAALFETMDPAFAAGFLARMRSDSAAGIMTSLSPDAAYTISVILAGRNASVPTE